MVTNLIKNLTLKLPVIHRESVASQFKSMGYRIVLDERSVNKMSAIVGPEAVYLDKYKNLHSALLLSDEQYVKTMRQDLNLQTPQLQ